MSVSVLSTFGRSPSSCTLGTSWSCASFARPFQALHRCVAVCVCVRACVCSCVCETVYNMVGCRPHRQFLERLHRHEEPYHPRWILCRITQTTGTTRCHLIAHDSHTRSCLPPSPTLPQTGGRRRQFTVFLFRVPLRAL